MCSCVYGIFMSSVISFIIKNSPLLCSIVTSFYHATKHFDKSMFWFEQDLMMFFMKFTQHLYLSLSVGLDKWGFMLYLFMHLYLLSICIIPVVYIWWVAVLYV